jgi:hypothetical protein
VIISERNKVAVAALDRALSDGCGRTALLYGGLHGADLDQRLTAQLGLRRAGTRWLTAWRIPAPDAVAAGHALPPFLAAAAAFFALDAADWVLTFTGVAESVSVRPLPPLRGIPSPRAGAEIETPRSVSRALRMPRRIVRHVGTGLSNSGGRLRCRRARSARRWGCSRFTFCATPCFTLPWAAGWSGHPARPVHLRARCAQRKGSSIDDGHCLL